MSEVCTNLEKSLDGFSEWIYENYSISNRDDLVNAMENSSLMEAYLTDIGLPLDTELEWL